MNIVPTNQKYYYSLMMQNLQELKQNYPFLEIGNIGFSTLGKQLPYIKIGRGSRKIMYNAGMHANEYICCILLMKFVENFCQSYVLNSRIFGQNARELFNNVSLYILPMMNPDGIDLVTGRVDTNSKEYKKYLEISESFPNIPFPSGWKANANGVDLKNYQPICKALQLFTCTILRTFIFILFYQFFTTIINSTYFQTIIFS